MLTYFFNRQRNILDYALGSLWRQRWKNSSVVLVFALVIFLISSFRLAVSSLEVATRQMLETVPDIVVQKLAGGRQVGLVADLVAELEQVYGVHEVRPRVWGYYFDETNGANYTVIGDPGFFGEADPAAPVGQEGHGATGGQSYAAIGSAVRGNMELGDRRNFSLFRPDLSLKSFAVRSVFEPSTGIVTDDLVVTDIEAVRDLFMLDDDEVTDFLVYVSNPAEIDTVARKISEKVMGSRVITREQISKTYQMALGWRSGFGIACLIGSLAAFIILAWDKASGLSPDQRREVGLLKVLGWQTSDIMVIRFWESVVISLTAFLLGFSIACLHVLWFDSILYRPILLGWSVLRPAVDLVPSFNLADLVLIFCLSVVPYLVATIVPAWRSAVVRPDVVI
jgi:ABC-type lipoprotein release transport system permease subunit